jgi:hypothetical protein
MKLLVHQAFMITSLILATLVSAPSSSASESAWVFYIEVPAIGCMLGAQSTSVDGYDTHDEWGGTRGQPGWGMVAPYHQSGDDWSGSTGFYASDFHAPLIGDRTSTTWDMYFWAQDYWNDASIISAHTFPYPAGIPPSWYQARLYLDYVPPEASWEGPTVFDISVTGYTYFDLPIVAVSNPLDGVRMHFTVATPEPSSLLALGGGLMGLAGLALRRRRR